MYYVYVLTSVTCPAQHYTGFTADLKQRLVRHNGGYNRATADGRPCEIACYTAFPDSLTALAFERYLKSGSGRTFAKRHLL